MNTILRNISVVLFYFVLLNFSCAQRVGLVLSGGGARGLAHIGVIKALEENGIPIDYVTGTSMGAIIGGMYAAGYSPEMMERIVTSEEFVNWANGSLPEKYIYYFKKHNLDPSWVTVKFRWDSIFSAALPTNMVSPILMDLAFLEIFSQSSAFAKDNFDSLFVPFRCVASDIESSEAYSPKYGNLGQMIRASMTIPFVFKPILINGKLMFDGGIYNNFPVDVMQREFKPDIIIGSQVVTNFDPPDPNDVLTQIENMIVSRTNFDIQKDSGVMIRPKLQDVSILDFERAKEMIDIGYATTIEHISEIKKMVKRKVEKFDVSKLRYEFNSALPPLIIDDVTIKGLTISQSDYVSKLLTKKGKTVTFEEMKTQYLKIIADDKIANIYPRLVYNSKTGYFDMFLDIEKDKPFLAEIGGNMSSTASSLAYVGLQYKAFNEKSLSLFSNVYFSKFYMSAQLKARIDFPYLLPYYMEGDVTYNNWDYFKSSGAFFQNVRPSYLIQSEQHTAFNIGLPTESKGKLVAGIAQGFNLDQYYHKDDFAKNDTPDKTYFNFFVTSLLFERNTLNKKQFAFSGTFLKASIKYITGKEISNPGSTSFVTTNQEKYHNRIVGRLVYENYFKRINDFKIGFYTEDVISQQRFCSNYYATMLQSPTFLPTTDSKTFFLEKFRAFNYAAVGLKCIWLINNNLSLRIEGYCFQPYKELMKDENDMPYFAKAFSIIHWMGSAAVVYHTPFGPVSLSYNLYDENYKSQSILLNFGYIIFNEKITE